MKLEREGSPFAGEVVSKFTAAGALIASWGDSTPTPNGQLTGAGAAEGPFAGQLDGIAVDASGDLWVLDSPSQAQGDMFEFEPEGGFVKAFEVSGPSPSGLAVNGAGDLFYADWLSERVEQVSSTGQSVGRASESHNPAP